MTVSGPRGRLLTTRRGLLGMAGAAGSGLLLPRHATAADQPAWRRPLAESDAVIAFGHTGPITDGGWSMVHDRGVQAVRRAFPRLRTIYVESVPYSADATRIFRQFVAEGAQMVFATSEYGDFIKDVSDRAPDVAFMECDGNNVTGNLGWYYVAHWYASYIIGIAAGLMTRTGKLGFLGSFPIPSVYASANATLLGAQSVNPSITMQAITINAWFDPQAATQAATALADNGCDFLCGIMDEPAYLRVAVQRGLKAAMWNTGMLNYGPEAYVSSVSLDFNDFYVSQVRDLLAGTWQPQGRFLTLGHGVDRDAWGPSVPESVARQADDMRTRILAGYVPFTGPIHDNHGQLRVPAGVTPSDLDIYHSDWAVAGVSGLE
ncbi:BMP family ABC transporter substrate-binding protein [Komagataeibacter saccharivorans]|uniref:BMP family ABC transporter substrate-binding protein n=1 Tax=Komagataeibacter saccharivorans TaxID=265959 RepID=UPI000D7B9DA9|nr:BMP family ABC transporter substrate-binding protein [Komagataeibacter saccharivorans]PYD50241.1 BMP family ABC transporter substrate-binding protein [Komagataeibacter saccharivorans]GBQ41498.1 basic membrane lipoprotein [Komagataeibacter saccharivorans NRIC 0614]